MDTDAVTELALAAGRGDQVAAAEFVRATQGDVWRYVAYLVDRGNADDLTQETYLRALRGLRTFRGETAGRIWLLSIARRVVADHFRKQGRRPNVVAPLDGADGLRERVRAEGDSAEEVSVRMLIAALDPDKRDAFVLTQIHGLSYAEAAQSCGVPIGTIRSRMARAREQLVADLADPLEHSEGRRLRLRRPR
jgi:RNA polymerase sigma-70 factor (ECF subfamily)